MFGHKTVLQHEAVEGLNIKADGIYVDCTLGGAGHSKEICQRLDPSGLLIGLDHDDAALMNAKEELSSCLNKVELVKSNFRRLEAVIHSLGMESADGEGCLDGVLFDLGVSSPQLDEADRGFSYNRDAELDMRMDPEAPLTAKIIVNEWPQEELTKILFQYGEEKFSKRIAARILQERQRQPINTTLQLAEIIKSAIPAAARRSGPHPAKRSFQAIRIAVNDELNAFQEALDQAIQLLHPGGRVAVITFHSLEDRICKRTFAKFVGKCTCPPDFPVCVCQKKGLLKLINRKPITASEEELTDNPRARSAKLRTAERLAESQ